MRCYFITILEELGKCAFGYTQGHFDLLNAFKKIKEKKLKYSKSFFFKPVKEKLFLVPALKTVTVMYISSS